MSAKKSITKEKNRNKEIPKCFGCGRELDFPEESLSQMIVCPYCCQRINESKDELRSEFTNMFYYYLRKCGEQMVKEFLDEMGMLPVRRARKR